MGWGRGKEEETAEEVTEVGRAVASVADRVEVVVVVTAG